MQQLEKVNIVPAADEPSPPTVPAASNAITPMEMLNAAVARGADIAVLEKLMDLQERFEKNQARKAFDAAVSAAKSEIPVVVKNAKGHSGTYANFAAIAKTIDPIITKHGLSYRFRTVQSDRISVTCILSHHAGHSEENTLTGPADTSGSKNAIQAIGSTLSYLQRYSLVQALGLAAADDDDGNKSTDVEYITQEQADALRELIDANGKDRAKFLRWAKVEKIEDIPAGYYESCVQAITAKTGASR